MTPQKIKALAEKSLDADKALDTVTIDLNGQSALADYMIVASGTSSRHVASIAEKLRKRLESKGMENIRIEGLPNGDWAIVDAGDVLIHVFRPEIRSFYNIEKMWGPYPGFNVVAHHASA